MTKLARLYNFMDRNPVNKRFVGSIIALILFAGVYVAGTAVFNTVQDSIARQTRADDIARVKAAPAKDYVNFYSVKVDDAPIGDEPNLTLCRKLPKGSVKIDAVRTFVRYNDGMQTQVEARAFTAAIEQSITNTDCTTVPLRGQPQSIGTYSIFTDYCFNIEIHGENVKKCDNYSSNKYELTDNLEAIKARLEALQLEYDRRLSNQSNAESSSSIAQSAPSVASPQATTTPDTPATAATGNTGGNNNSGGNTGNQSRGGITLDLPFLPPITLFGN